MGTKRRRIAWAVVVVAMACLLALWGARPAPEPVAPDAGVHTVPVDDLSEAPRTRRERVKDAPEPPKDYVFSSKPVEEESAPEDAAPMHEYVVVARDQDGRGVPHLHVALSRAHDPARGGSSVSGGNWENVSTRVVASGRTDHDGRTRIDASLEEWVSATATSDHWLGASGRVRVEGEAPTTIELTVSAAFRLRGVARFSDGAPAASARVYLQRSRAPHHPSNLQSVIADERGSFAFEPETSVPGSQLRVYVSGAGVPGKAVELAERRGSIDDVEVIVERGTRVSGRCVDEDGKPINFVRIRGIFPGTGEITHSDEWGRFTITVPGSGGGLVFWKEGLVQVGRRDLRGPPEGVDIGDVVLPRGGVIAGHVVDLEGEPIDGADVTVSDPVTMHAAFKGRTDGLGKFRATLIGKGGHTVWTRAPVPKTVDGHGIACWTRHHPIHAGNEGVVLTVAPGIWRPIELRDSDGEPLTAAIRNARWVAVDDPDWTVGAAELQGQVSERFMAQFPTSGRYRMTITLVHASEVIEREIEISESAAGPIVIGR